jgi:YD repeat-containing protein
LTSVTRGYGTASAGITTYDYDNAGRKVSETDALGHATSYTYDALNRLLTRATPGESPVSFTYTPTGKYLTSTAGDGTVNYAYDSLDRLTAKATPESGPGGRRFESSLPDHILNNLQWSSCCFGGFERL